MEITRSRTAREVFIRRGEADAPISQMLQAFETQNMQRHPGAYSDHGDVGAMLISHTLSATLFLILRCSDAHINETVACFFSDFAATDTSYAFVTPLRPRLLRRQKT
jgi:hypothetical protein